MTTTRAFHVFQDTGKGHCGECGYGPGTSWHNQLPHEEGCPALRGKSPVESDCVCRRRATNTVVDMVNEPPHYKTKSGLQAIDVIEAFELSFKLGTVVKYLLRSGKKFDALEDLKKARWYLSREIENQEKALEKKGA